MGRIPREVVEAVRERTEITEVVRRHVTLVRAGKDWKGLCPFHQEKSPSFHVIPHKGIYHCFGCQAGGDVFRFLMEIEGLGFSEAVKELAQAAGVDVPERELSHEERRRLRARAGLFDVVQAAADHFSSNLWTSADGEVARTYLTERGISDELARSSGLGWAPPSWDNLATHLERMGFDADLAIKAGLVKPRKNGNGVYDGYRERVIFPIRDERGRTIGFGGRTLSSNKEEAKYINSAETPLYQKSKVLYGFDMARRAMAQRDRAILVEGYFDVLSLHEAGFSEAVAVCGTALTPEHAEKLRRVTGKLIVITDSDSAGKRAASKMLPALMGAGIASFRLDVPGAKDPDELVREEGAEAMEKALKTHTTSLLTWVARQHLKENGYDASGKQRALDEMSEVLGELSAAEASELAAVLRLDERTVLQKVRAASQRTKVPAHYEAAAAAAPPDEGWTPDRDVVHLLWLVVHRYGEVADLVMRSDPKLLDRHAAVRPAIARLLQSETVTSILDTEPDPGVRRTLSAVAARAKLYAEGIGAISVCQVLARLAKPQMEGRMAELKWRATADARSGRAEEARKAFTELAALNARQRALEHALQSGDVHAAASMLGPSDEPGEPAQVAPTVPEVDSGTASADEEELPAEKPVDYHTEVEIPPEVPAFGREE